VEPRREQSQNTAYHVTWRKIEDPSVHGSQQLIGSQGTTLSLGHRTKGPTQCTIGTQDFSENFGDKKFRKRLTSEQYLRNIKDGPINFFTWCGGTWFPSKVSGLNIHTISSKYPNFSVDNAFYLSIKFPSPSGKYQFCSTCRQGLSIPFSLYWLQLSRDIWMPKKLDMSWGAPYFSSNSLHAHFIPWIGNAE